MYGRFCFFDLNRKLPALADGVLTWDIPPPLRLRMGVEYHGIKFQFILPRHLVLESSAGLL